MGVVKGKRKQSRFEAQHNFYNLRREITNLMLLNFGFSKEKFEKKIERFREQNKSQDNIDKIATQLENRDKSFQEWFIEEERGTVLNILRKIQSEFSIGNSIFPSDTPARTVEFCERRKHINEAIGLCHSLKQEIQYIITILPVDYNKYEKYAEIIDKQIALFKGLRQSDNRFVKNCSKTSETKNVKLDIIRATFV